MTREERRTDEDLAALTPTRYALQHREVLL